MTNKENPQEDTKLEKFVGPEAIWTSGTGTYTPSPGCKKIYIQIKTGVSPFIKIKEVE